MLFPLACLMDHRYNLEGTKLVITQISNTLNFETPIIYRNIESCLCEMHYKIYVQ